MILYILDSLIDVTHFQTSRAAMAATNITTAQQRADIT